MHIYCYMLKHAFIFKICLSHLLPGARKLDRVHKGNSAKSEEKVLEDLLSFFLCCKKDGLLLV